MVTKGLVYTHCQCPCTENFKLLALSGKETDVHRYASGVCLLSRASKRIDAHAMKGYDPVSGQRSQDAAMM